MIPHAIKRGSIEQRHISIWRTICDYVQRLVIEDGSCHDVCRSIIENYTPPLELEWVKGKFNGADHSWLRFKSEPWIIIDAYPWACASGPILITTEGVSPWYGLYRGEEEIWVNVEMKENEND